MPNRILREGIVTSARIAALGWPAEVFYRRLMSVVDDFGRYHAHPMLLRAACYPMQLDKVSDSDVGKWLGETRKAALVRVYESSGAAYLELLDFKQQVRAKKSKFPDPPPDAEQTLCDCVADAQHMPAVAHLDVDVSEGEGGTGKRPKASRKKPLPTDFAVSDRVRQWASEKQIFNVDDHLEPFKSKCRANGYAYVDWDHSFMEAVRNDWARIGHGNDASKPRKVAL
jgi:hypothetical protein